MYLSLSLISTSKWFFPGKCKLEEGELVEGLIYLILKLAMPIFFIWAIFATLKKKAYTVCISADLPITGYTDISCFQILVDLMLHTSPLSALNCIFSIHMSKTTICICHYSKLASKKMRYFEIWGNFKWLARQNFNHGWQKKVLWGEGRRRGITPTLAPPLFQYNSPRWTLTIQSNILHKCWEMEN